MKIQIIRIGRPAHQEAAGLAAQYEKRLTAFTKIESVEWRAPLAHAAKARTPAKKSPQKSAGEFLVALDERGAPWSSEELASKISKWIDDPRIKSLSFLVGGPYGLDDATRESADAVWSLSRATLPADLAWVLVWEQVYRAFTILKGMPYHHG